MPRPRQEIIDNPIPTSLFFNGVHIYKCSPSTHKQQNSCIVHKQRCRDRVINDFLSRSRHLLVPLLFHEVTSLHQCCRSVGFYPNTTDFRCPNSGYGFVSVNLRIFFGSLITYILT